MLEKKMTMVVKRQKIDGHVLDATTDLKTKLAQLRCKSLRRNNTPRFNRTSFLLVHSREKLWNITIFCLGRKKEEEGGERACCGVSFRAAERAFI